MKKTKSLKSTIATPLPSPSIDPENINARLHRQVGRLLTDLENDEGDITVRERIAALVAIGRIQTIFVGLRKEKGTKTDAGSAVRKYASAFTSSQNAVDSGTTNGDEPADDGIADIINFPNDDADDAA